MKKWYLLNEHGIDVFRTSVGGKLIILISKELIPALAQTASTSALPDDEIDVLKEALIGDNSFGSFL